MSNRLPEKYPIECHSGDRSKWSNCEFYEMIFEWNYCIYLLQMQTNMCSYNCSILHVWNGWLDPSLCPRMLCLLVICYSCPTKPNCSSLLAHQLNIAVASFISQDLSVSRKRQAPHVAPICVDPCNINTSPLNHHHMPSWLRCIICYVGACGNSRFAILWENPCKPPSRREYIVDQMTTKQ